MITNIKYSMYMYNIEAGVIAEMTVVNGISSVLELSYRIKNCVMPIIKGVLIL